MSPLRAFWPCIQHVSDSVARGEGHLGLRAAGFITRCRTCARMLGGAGRGIASVDAVCDDQCIRSRYARVHFSGVLTSACNRRLTTKGAPPALTTKALHTC